MIRVDIIEPIARLTLIASDPRISGALMILSVTKMILIYLNYRIWFIKMKVIHENVLNTLVFDGDGKQLKSKLSWSAFLCTGLVIMNGTIAMSILEIGISL